MNHISRKIKTAAIYILFSSAIGLWWYAAFKQSDSSRAQEGLASKPYQTFTLSPPSYYSYLTALDRSQIQKGLAGDIAVMTRLISEWDVDATILENNGLPQVQKLTREKFLKAQMIGRRLLHTSGEELVELRGSYAVSKIFDDLGVEFQFNKAPTRFLPQTYVSASLLLSLTETENIVAIPRDLRLETSLYPTSLTDKIALDHDRYNSEAIYQTKPDVAFVADYSNPFTLQALRDQGIPLYTVKAINNLQEITHTITKIGHVIYRPLEAELLTLFMEASLMAIDNRLMAMTRENVEKYGSPKIIFLQYYSRLSVPTERTISGQLLKRFHTRNFTFHPPFDEHAHQWTIPITQEAIVDLDPDCLIIATSHGEALLKEFRSNPAYSALSAIKQNRVYFIDSAPQNPSQYVILAYYDIADALVKASSPYLK